jgi:hypothetical protein
MNNIATRIVLSAVDNTRAGVESARNEFQSLSETLDKMPWLGGLAAGLAGIVSVGAIKTLITDTVTLSDEISRLAELAGASTDEFQGLAAGAKTFGIESEALANIYKDFREKLGEFTATGGGELKDFFEQVAAQVGVTADAFKNLSGPQALQLYYNTLDKANVSNEEMVFFLESAASDATLLIPLLREDGAAFKAAADQAKAYGAVLSSDVIAASSRLSSTMTEMDQMMQGTKNTIASALIPTVVEITQGLFDFAKGGTSASNAGESLNYILKGVAISAGNVAYVLSGVRDEMGGIAAQIVALAKLDFNLFSNIGEAMREDAEKNRKAIDGWTAKVWNAGKGGEFFGPPDPPKKSNRPAWTPTVKPDKPKAAKKSKSASSSGSVSDYDAILAERVARAIDQTDLIKANELAATLAKLDQIAAAGLDPAIVAAVRDDLTGATKAAADEVKRLNDLLADTPTAQIEKARDDMLFLTAALDAKKITEMQYLEAVTARVNQSTEKTLTDLDQFAIEAAKNTQDAFADFLFDPFQKGLDGMLVGFGEVVRRMIANAVAADLGNRLLGSGFGKDGKIGGLLGDLLKGFGGSSLTGDGTATENWIDSGGLGGSGGGSWFSGALGFVKGLLPSFDVGTSYVPYDMIAKIHKGEEIIPAGKSRQGGHSVSLTINMGGNAGAADVRRAGGQVAREVLGLLETAGRYR